jgi:putative ABC transport system substrate-binding protein
MYPWRNFADVGGLLSYGNIRSDAARRVGLYAGRILKVEKAGDLPVWVPTKQRIRAQPQSCQSAWPRIPAALPAFTDEVIE